MYYIDNIGIDGFAEAPTITFTESKFIDTLARREAGGFYISNEHIV